MNLWLIAAGIACWIVGIWGGYRIWMHYSLKSDKQAPR